MFALEEVDLFNILCIPYMARLTDTAAAEVITKATAYCHRRRAILIVDIPQSVRTVEQVGTALGRPT